MLKNKFEKISLSFSGVLFVIAVVLGMKVKSDAQEKESLKEAIANNVFDEKQFEIQKEIDKDRAEIINKITNSPGEKVIEEISTTTTTPVIKKVETPVQVVTKKADKKTKSS